MKILFIAHEATRTGAPMVLLNVITKLKQENYKCDVLLLRGGKLEINYKTLADKFFFVKERSIFQIGIDKLFKRDPIKNLAGKLCRKFKNNNYDLIYANTAVTANIASEIKRKLHIKTLLHVHELEYAINDLVGNTQFKHYSKSVDFFIAVSKANKEYLTNTHEINASKISILYPYPNPKPYFHNHEIESNLGITSETFVIGGAGQISWTKGVDIFMLVAKEFAKRSKYNNYKFIWVGAYPQSNKEFAQFDLFKKKLELNNIFFTGEVDNPYDFYNYFSVFLMTSFEESFSLVAVENALLKKPIVCFEKCGGVNEWVKDGAGIEVPFCNINQMVDALTNLEVLPEERKKLGIKAHETVTKEYNEEVFGRDLLKIMKSISK